MSKKTLQKLNEYWDMLKEGPEAPDLEQVKNAQLWQLNDMHMHFPTEEAAKSFIAQALEVPVESLVVNQTLEDMEIRVKGSLAIVANIWYALGHKTYGVTWITPPAEMRYIDGQKPMQEEAEADVPHGTNEPKEETAPKTEIEVNVKAVSVEVENTKKASLYGKTPDFVLFKDTNSKPVTPVDREMGAKEAIKDFKVTDVKMDVTSPVDREMGAKEAIKDFKVTDVKIEPTNPVGREMGAKEAPKKYLEEYKSDIGNILTAIKEQYKI
jgi:hypothetical protein